MHFVWTKPIFINQFKVYKMKKFYMILAAVAAMTMSAQAQDVNYGALEVGDFENPAEIYNGSYFDMAPTNFYLAHTGAQMIYTVNELGDLQNLAGVKINKLTFKFNNAGTWEDIYRDVKLYLEETDATEFAVVEGVKQFFTFADPVLETQVSYELMNTMGEDVELALELAEPFALASGKNLLVTVAFDAEDDDNCTMGSDYAPFYTSASAGRQWFIPTTGPVLWTMLRERISPMLPPCWVAAPTWSCPLP